MFAPDVIEAREADLVRRLGPSSIPGGALVRRPHAECWILKDQLEDALDAQGQPARPLTPVEQAFIAHEQILATIDYRHWSERWAIVSKEQADSAPLVPRWASQDLFLARIAKLESDRYFRGYPDGLLFNVLKARQLGISTETEVILAHAITTQPGVRGLVSGDVPEQSEYLFSMAERVIANLPWWLKPRRTKFNTGAYWEGSNGASLRIAAGKSQRGGLQDKGGTKGNIGRGKTFQKVHISEVSTWERPEQLKDALLWGVPRRPQTFGVFESTAKGRNDFWHNWWKESDRGLTRFTNIFIPWYIEPDKYWLPPPDGWEPGEVAKAHADQVTRTSATYCLGKTIRLSREQLYWYECEYAAAEEADDLNRFHEEMPAVPEEAFQHSGRSVFSTNVLERLARQERTPQLVLHVEPMKDIAQLKAWEREEAKRLAGEGAS